MERAGTILALQDRIYRLALFVAGDARRAARLVERAFRRLPDGSADPERALVDALLPARDLRWRWRPDPAAAVAAGLAPDEVRALRGLLAAAAPAARLALGARALLGLDLPPPIAAAPAPGAPWPRRPPDLVALRATLARTIGGAPAGAGYAELRDYALLRDGVLPEARAAELRATLLADGAVAERARALRDAVARADERIAAVLPALFVAGAPPELTERLLRAAAPRRFALPPALRLQLGLCAAVALLLAAALLMPRSQPQADTGAVAAAPALAPASIVELALDRFGAGAPVRGVLHERYLAESGGERWRVERWYGYAPPHPLRVEVRDGADRLVLALATDGRELVQRRAADETGRLAGRDVPMSPAEIAALLPILRQQPDGVDGVAQGRIYGLDRYYLGLARGAELTDLGATTVAGRPARLIAFQSPAALPPPSGQSPPQTVLAVDVETYGLLEVRLIPAGAAAGVVELPWRAEAHEILAAGPDDGYLLQ